MRVWVVMGNDYPAAVFDTEEAAKSYIKTKDMETGGAERGIYWRAYDFSLNEEAA
jgi:hypothetical protein